MLKPRPRTSRRFWEGLSDTELIEAELITDDPERLPNLVYEVPSGDEESYVEFKYDLRGTDRERFVCVHGHHKHLAGFVFRKGDARFLVGWICGSSIYGEDFEKYTADFDAAVNRQDALRRVREVKAAIDPFFVWMQQVSEAEAFKQFSRVRGTLNSQMPWVYDNMERASIVGARSIGAAIPRRLCAAGTDPRAAFAKIVSDAAAASMMLAGEPSIAAQRIGLVRSRMETLLKQAEDVLEQLKELEAFFQPAVLDAICKLANEYDHPKKRRYSYELMSITCKRDRDKTTIMMPRNFTIPSKKPLEIFRSVLANTK